MTNFKKKADKEFDNYIPGEEFFVNKMLYEIVEKTNYFSYVNPDNIVLFESNGNLVRFKDLDDLYLNNDNDQGIALFLETVSNETFDRPRFKIDRNYILEQSYKKDMRKLNAKSPAFILTNASHRKALIEILILKYLLEINEGLELSFNTFKRGLEIRFPNPSILENNPQLLDKEMTEMIYQVSDYYYIFENTFNEVNNSYK